MKVSIQCEQPKYNYQFEVADTGIIGITGASGSGKSSLLNALAGFNDNNKGTISFNNKELEGIVKCSYMNQHPILFPHWNVKENLHFAMQYSHNEAQQLEHLLQQLNCEALLNKFPHQLSGGEKQRIAFIRALISIGDNSLVLLDEPFSALHPELRKMALKLLTAYKSHCLIFMVTHDVSEIYHYADELLLIEDGGINYQNNIKQAMVSNHSHLPLASHVQLGMDDFVVYADDVSINLSKNTNSSISYQLDVIIEKIIITNNQAVLKLQLQKKTNDKPTQYLYAKLTLDSINRLQLAEHKQVIACFKSNRQHSNN